VRNVSISKLEAALEFTNIYRKYINEHKAIREVKCLQSMFKHYFDDIIEGDLFAGRIQFGVVSFSLESEAGGSIYDYNPEEIQNMLDTMNLTEDYRLRILDMTDFWKEEKSTSKFIKRLPEELLSHITGSIAHGTEVRLAGTYINYEKLVLLGLPGIISEVLVHRENAKKDGRDIKFYDGALMALELYKDICRDYAKQAKSLAETTQNEGWKIELNEMSRILDKITVSKPETMREAIQLVWLYILASSTLNFGRMDEYLGDFLARDLKLGILTEESALVLTQSLWKLIVARRIVSGVKGEFDARIIIGGKGRLNEENADSFALLAMETTNSMNETEPQLTLRFYKGMNPKLMKKALDVIGEGKTFPILYNDDINIPAVEIAFNISTEEAEQYMPYGCGEYTINHTAFGSPNSSMNLQKALEVTLHNGRDGMTGKLTGIKIRDIQDFLSFDDLLDAYKKQVEFHVECLSRKYPIELEMEDECASYLLVSILFDNCLESGRSIVGRGTNYTGGLIEVFGITNVSDSLTAIKEIVYEKKLFSLGELVKILDSNFEGYQREHKLLLSVPKYGNDNHQADLMVQDISNHISRFTNAQASKVGLDYFMIVSINNFYNVEAGYATAASADGRKKGEPLANANTPTAGMDTSGITALLNSISKVDPTAHAGYVQNIKFSKQLFKEERPKIEALLSTYFENGGTQAMISVVSRGDLENAMKAPEMYGNLIVRVGGFSVRFVEISEDIQRDILKRTLY
jgi:pyruvate-formate lyase